jgi:hypothetical protein
MLAEIAGLGAITLGEDACGIDKSCLWVAFAEARTKSQAERAYSTTVLAYFVGGYGKGGCQYRVALVG